MRRACILVKGDRKLEDERPMSAWGPNKRLVLISVAALITAVSLPALADEAVPGAMAPGRTPPSSADTMWQFGQQRKLCIEWTDGCRVCRRIDANEMSCSNVGIACRLEEIRCTAGETGTPN
jgi:hypothetical protein